MERNKPGRKKRQSDSSPSGRQQQQHQIPPDLFPQMLQSGPGMGGNPLGLLQQQMNAMLGQGQGQGRSSGREAEEAGRQQEQQAAAFWYLEYLSRIQAAQMASQGQGPQGQSSHGSGQQAPSGSSGGPSSHSQSQPKQEKRKQSSEGRQHRPQQAHPQPPSGSGRGSHRGRQGQGQGHPHHPPKQRDSASLLAPTPNPTPPPKKIPKEKEREEPLPQPPASAGEEPPAAHSTPADLSSRTDIMEDSDRPRNKERSTPPPAHASSTTPILYSHSILKPPPLGMFPFSLKRPATSATPAPAPYRPWLQDSVAGVAVQGSSSATASPLTVPLPPLKKTRRGQSHDQELSDVDPLSLFLHPLTAGWVRTTHLRSHLDLDSASVVYQSPHGMKCRSVQEVKKALKTGGPSNLALNIKNFSFNPTLKLGNFMVPFEAERIQLTAAEFFSPSSDLLALLQKKLKDVLVKREEETLIRLRKQQEKMDRERRTQHAHILKALELLRKAKRRQKKMEALKEVRKEEKDHVLEDEILVKKKIKSEGEGEEASEEHHADLFPLIKLNPPSHVTPISLGYILQVYEFLHTFGEPLGFDLDSLPDLQSLLKSFLGDADHEEELVSIIVHLIVCMVEDPGLPNPAKHVTIFNQTLKQADVNSASFSEVLRVYLEGISDSEPEAEEHANYLLEAPFLSLSVSRKSSMVAFLCDVLLQNKAVIRALDSASEEIGNIKKERGVNDVKVRKLRMAVNRKVVGEAMTGVGEENLEEEEDLSVDELKGKIEKLNNKNEKLLTKIAEFQRSIRTPSLGQDRFRRRYWNLPNCGGVWVEGFSSSAVNDQELRAKIEEKFKDPDSDKENVENINPEPEEQEDASKSQPQPPPPVIRIFSFSSKPNCSAKAPPAPELPPRPSDDEVFVKGIKRELYSGWWKLEKNDVKDFSSSLLENGMRERELKAGLEEGVIGEEAPAWDFEEEEEKEEEPQTQEDKEEVVDSESLQRAHLALLEAAENLEERVASASLQIKNWTVPPPLPRSLSLPPFDPAPIALRLLDLENAVERRYLKPPLGKSAIELNLSNLVGEENSSALSFELSGSGLILGGPTGSTSSTRGAQIQENNKLLREREEARRKTEEKAEGGGERVKGLSRLLLTWRDVLRRLSTHSPSNASSTPPASNPVSTLTTALHLLDSSLAWDKSVMRAACQLCKGGDHEDKLLLCDACDRGYHTYCFKPPLETIPEGDWFCYECINKATGVRGCIVCGKGQASELKEKCGKGRLLTCDKCPKAFHVDCLPGNFSVKKKGRWTCPDHVAPSSPSKKDKEKEKDVSCSSSPKKKSHSKDQDHPQPERPESPPPSHASSSSSSAGGSHSQNHGSSGSGSKEGASFQSNCTLLLDTLSSHPDAWPFLEPVNTRTFPTYKKVIKTPMDLGTVRGRLDAGEYKTKEEFLEDIELVFDNCETFNEDDSPVGKAGHSLRSFFREKLGELGGL